MMPPRAPCSAGIMRAVLEYKAAHPNWRDNRQVAQALEGITGHVLSDLYTHEVFTALTSNLPPPPPPRPALRLVALAGELVG